MGVYSKSVGGSSACVMLNRFIPISNYLYFNVDVRGCSTQPFLTVNRYNNDGTLTYIGSYNIYKDGTNNYKWDNYKRSLTAGTPYVFSVLVNSSSWSSATVDIYKESM